VPRAVSPAFFTSLASRTVIDQAIGVLMGQRRITAGEAFAILRATSQNRNIKLRAFAAQIVEGASARPPQRPLRPAPLTCPDPGPRAETFRTDRNLILTNCGITHVRAMIIP
jgi:hypothetical protein